MVRPQLATMVAWVPAFAFAARAEDATDAATAAVEAAMKASLPACAVRAASVHLRCCQGAWVKCDHQTDNSFPVFLHTERRTHLAV